MKNIFNKTFLSIVVLIVSLLVSSSSLAMWEHSTSPSSSFHSKGKDFLEDSEADNNFEHMSCESDSDSDGLEFLSRDKSISTVSPKNLKNFIWGVPVIICGSAVVTAAYYLYSSLFGSGTSSDDIESDKEDVNNLLEIIRGVEDPTKMENLPKAPISYYERLVAKEEKLRGKALRHFRQSQGYDEVSEQRKVGLRNDDYAFVIIEDFEKEISRGGDYGDICNEGYNRDKQERRIELVDGIIMLAGPSNGESSTVAKGKDSGNAATDSASSSSADDFYWLGVGDGKRIEVNRNDTKMSLVIKPHTMRDKSIDDLTSLLAQDRVKHLFIEGNDRKDDSKVDKVIEALRGNISLESLRVNRLSQSQVVLLVEALQPNTSSLKKLVLGYTILSDEVLEVFAEFLESKNSFQSLDFYKVGMDAQGGFKLMKSIVANRHLQTLEFDGCSFFDKKAMEVLAERLREEGCELKKLEFQEYPLDAREEFLLIAESLKVNRSLRFVSFGGGGDAGKLLISFADALKENDTLLILQVFAHTIGERAMTLLVESLAENKTLQMLYFGDISEREVEVLSGFLKRNEGFLRGLFFNDEDDDCEGRGLKKIAMFSEALKTNSFLEAFSYGDGDDIEFEYSDDTALCRPGHISIPVGGEELLEEALEENVSLISLSGMAEPSRISPNLKRYRLVRLLMINDFLRNHLLDAGILERKRVKVEMMRYWINRNIGDISEDVFRKEIELIFRIVKIEEAIESKELNREKLKKMIKEVSTIFGSIFVEKTALRADKGFLAHKVYQVYQSAISSLDKITGISDAEREKLKKKWRKESIALLAYIYGSLLKSPVEGKPVVDKDDGNCNVDLVDGSTADSYGRVLSIVLVEEALGKDEWQSYEEHFDDEETKKKLLKCFLEAILSHKKRSSHSLDNVDFFYGAETMCLQKVLFSLFGKQEIETIIKFKKKEIEVMIEMKRELLTSLLEELNMVTEKMRTLENRIKSLEETKREMLHSVAEDGREEEILELETIEGIDKKIEDSEKELSDIVLKIVKITKDIGMVKQEISIYENRMRDYESDFCPILSDETEYEAIKNILKLQDDMFDDIILKSSEADDIDMPNREEIKRAAEKSQELGKILHGLFENDLDLGS